ncbi:MAG: hypothetical protein ACYCVD_09865 [Desulfitobacteriaceae bacterium]
MTKERIKLISLVGLLIFGLLLSGRLIYNKKWVDANLRQSEQIPGIVSVMVVGSSSQQEFDVTTKNVQDLAKTSQLLANLAGKLPIRFLDERNATLEKVFNQMQFALQEGIARGNFTEMQQKIEDLGTKAGIQVKLSIDSDTVYVILNQGSHQLVSVLERHGEGRFLSSEGNPAAKGGEG